MNSIVWFQILASLSEGSRTNSKVETGSRFRLTRFSRENLRTSPCGITLLSTFSDSLRIRRNRELAAHRGLLSGSAWSLGVQVFSKGSILITTLASARVLGVSDFGRFAALQAIALLAVSVWDLGFTPMMTRRLAAGEIDLQTLLRSCVRSRLCLFPLWIAVLIGGCYLVGLRGLAAAPIVVVFSIASFFDAFSSTLDAAVRATLDFRASAVANSISRLVFAAAALLVWLVNPRQALVAMAICFLIGEFVVLLLLARHPAFVGSISRLRRPWLIPEPFWSMQRDSAPFAANGFLILVYNRLDVAIVTALATATQAGLYTPASRIQDALLIAPATVVTALTPIAAHQFGTTRDRQSIKKSLRFSIVLSLLLAIPGTVGVFLFAPQIVRFALGGEYAGSVTPIRIVAASIPFIAIGSPVMSVLIAIDRAASTTWMIASGFVVAIGGMWLLTPRYGAEGAAWASMAREPVIAALGVLLLFRYLRSTAGPVDAA